MKFVLRLTSALSASVCLLTAAPSFLTFEPSDGENAIARTPDGAVLFDSEGALLLPGKGSPVRMRLTGARKRTPELLERLESYSNYLLGPDQTKWRKHVPHFRRVRYSSVLPGIDVVYYGSEGRLEYDFVVSPGADPGQIQIAFEGARQVRTTETGDLLLETGSGSIRHLRPRIYQTVDGQQVEIAGSYKLRSDGKVEFALADYDHDRELVVDPVVQFSQYVGRGGQDTSAGIATDGAGNAYIAGQTNSASLAVGGVFQPLRSPESDAWIAKLSPSGQVLWVTYCGGSRPDGALAVAADEGGNVYVTGFTYSPDFPARGGPQAQSAGGDFDSFVAKINTTGSSLVWSTYLGGNSNDWASDIAVEADGAVWVAGWTTSTNFPLQGAFQGGYAGGGGDVFITRFAPSGGVLTYSSYFGAEGRDLASGIAVDAEGSIYVTGGTTSNGIPRVQSAQTRIAGGLDAFVFKLNRTRNEVVFSTLMGGAGDDYGIRVAVDPGGSAYVLGYTQSTDFPVTRGSAQSTLGGGYDMFVSRINAGAVTYATFLGGSGNDWAGGLAVDSGGSAYVAGWSNSPNFPVKNGAQTAYMGGDSPSSTQKFDAVAARISPGGDTFLYSTYLGGKGEDKAYGIALDRGNQVWITGTTTSADLPVPLGQFAVDGQGTTDAFVARLSPDTATALLSSLPATVRLTARLGDATPSQTTVAVNSTGGATQFTATTNAPWLQVTPLTGQAPGNLTLTVSAGQLTAGESRAEITLRSLSSSLTIPVIVNVTAAPRVLSTSPAQLPVGAENAALTIAGTGFTASSVVELNDVAAPTTFVDPQTIRVVIPNSLTRTNGTVRIVVANPDVRSIAYDLQVGVPAPAIAAQGIVSAATWQSGAIAPGQVVILGGANFGSSPLTTGTAGPDGRLATTLGDTRVLFDGSPAPIVWLTSGQAAVVVPASVAGRSQTAVRVEYRGQASAPQSIAVQPASPGIFTVSGNGTGAVPALNQNGTLNEPANPAERGSILVLYVTGLGTISPAVPDGTVIAGTESRPELPVSVSIGNVPASVEYAGGAPGQIFGLYQLNVRVPAGAPSGQVPIAVSAGSFSSPTAGVTVSIR